MPEPSARAQLFIGVGLIIAGAAMTLAVYSHSESLRVPAWVAYAAIAAFPLAGVVLLLRLAGAKRLATSLGVFLVGGLMVPFAFVALGPGPMECSGSFIGVSGIVPDWLCRAGFGFGALIGAVILVLVLRRVFARQDA